MPTRALANDKLAEWRARGWDVGIATGDLSENLCAPVVVATLETQKHRLIQGDGPALLVVDEYQMLSDLDRGLNYELAIALAPPQTQLLLLSGSVANPQDVVKWLQRLGRKAVLIRHEERPVPLEEVHANSLSYHVPAEIKGYWPRLVAKALAEDLGPILIFAPRRQAAESMAAEFARVLPVPQSPEPERRTKSARRRTPRQNVEKPRRLSSQRLELRRPRGRHRAARQGRPIARRRGHNGPGRGHQFLPAQRRPRRRILSARRGGATAAAR